MSDSKWFAGQLLTWFDQHGRKHLPWHRERSAYRVWLSEIMLQQTQVVTVIPYYERFISRFPTVHDLAAAHEDEVMRLWAGLGYYARARNLHACARQVSQQMHGEFPRTVDTLEALPGIGRSTAGAIVAQAYGQRAVILDGNVKRVLSRYGMVPGWPGKTAVQKTLWALAEDFTPDDRVTDYTQAIMDLGSMVCRRSRPQCDECPVRAGCKARRNEVTELYPEKKPRTRLPVRETHLLLCYQDDGRQSLLLEKRPPSGIWGGLWSLPQCEPGQDPADVMASAHGLEVIRVDETAGVTHRFTHFSLRIRPLWIQVRPGHRLIKDSPACWCSRESISGYGMPGPVSKLVNTFFQADTGIGNTCNAAQS